MKLVALTDSEKVWFAFNEAAGEARWEVRGGGGKWDNSACIPHRTPSRVIEMFADAGFELTPAGEEILAGIEDR